MLTPEQVAEIRVRADIATPTQWQTRFIYRMIKSARNSADIIFMTQPEVDWADADLMANARTDVLALCDTVDALRTKNKALAAHYAEARAALIAPWKARNQPCGCVICFCDHLKGCHGCGARFCRTDDCVFKSADAHQRIEYESAPSYVQLRADNEKLRKVVDCYREMEKQDRYAEKVGAMDAYIDAHRARDAAHHARLAGRRAMELLDADAALDAGKEE